MIGVEKAVKSKKHNENTRFLDRPRQEFSGSEFSGWE
jgi:hypothetical protein